MTYGPESQQTDPIPASALSGTGTCRPQEEESYQQYDISADRQMMTQTLVNSPEVDALASQIEVYNLESIVSFGAGAKQTRSPSAPTWYSTA